MFSLQTEPINTIPNMPIDNFNLKNYFIKYLHLVTYNGMGGQMSNAIEIIILFDNMNGNISELTSKKKSAANRFSLSRLGLLISLLFYKTNILSKEFGCGLTNLTNIYILNL